MFLRSILTNISITPSDHTLVYDHVSIVINACHITICTWHFDTTSYQLQDWNRPRWFYQSYGRSYKTSRLGSTYLSRPQHLGTLSFSTSWHINTLYYSLFICPVPIYFLCYSIEDQGGCCYTYKPYILYIWYRYPVRYRYPHYISFNFIVPSFFTFGFYIYFRYYSSDTNVLVETCEATPSVKFPWARDYIQCSIQFIKWLKFTHKYFLLSFGQWT